MIAIEPTLQSLAVLAGIVIIRTFLSFSLEVEIKGRWPWEREAERTVTPDLAGRPVAFPPSELAGQAIGTLRNAPRRLIVLQTTKQANASTYLAQV